MHMPSVSIIIPIYNMERYLPQCLDSVISQTMDDLEIICVDDGSNDSSPSILSEYSNLDPRIRIITKENSGYGDSMNIGIDASSGEYIGIVEPDDFIEPDMFEVLYKNASEHDLDISRCTFFYHTENGDVPERFPYVIKNKVYAPRDKPETFFQQPSDWVNLYRKAFLESNDLRFLPTPGASFQDTSFLFKAYACADRYMIVERPLYHYRLNENSSCRQSNSKLYYLCGEYEEIWSFIKEKGWYDRYKYLLAQIQFYGYKWNCMRLDNQYRMEFIEQWTKDFRHLNEEGVIRRFDYMPSDYRILSRILKNDGSLKNPSDFGLIDSKDKNTRSMSEKFSFAARWFVRFRNRSS